MRFKAATALLCVLMITGFAFAYESESTGPGGSNNTTPGGSNNTTDGDPEDPDDSTSTVTCNNGQDDNSDGSTDIGDGCVKPYYNDSVEGMIWESHLVSVMEGFSSDISDNSSESYNVNPSTTEAFFFSGFVQQGRDSSNRDYDSGNGRSVTLNWVDAARAEDDAYGFGYPKSGTFQDSDFGSYDGQDVVITNGRVIDVPHDNSEVCGNGLEENTDDDDKVGDDPNRESATTDCKKDYGEVNEIYDRSIPYEQPPCEGDYGFNGQTVNKTCDCDESSCSGSGCTSGSCSDGSCSASVEVNCSIDEDNSAQEGNHYFRPDGDSIIKYECQDDGNPEGTYSDQTDCSVSGCSSSWSTPSHSCDNPGGCSADGDDAEASDDCEAGDDNRNFQQVGTTDCSNHDVVHGGGDKNRNRADNDPAATFTSFTAHSDSSWGSAYMEGGDSQSGGDYEGSVWCGYDNTLTVNADGPEGNGDGFVVIDETQGSGTSRVVARESPDGSSSVGRNVHYGNNGDATTLDSTDYIGRADLSCSGEHNVCIKYVDFTTDTNNWDTVSGAVQANVEFEASPDESYSVCKTINRINEENGDVRGNDLIDCDYMSNGQSYSPLPEACGDEPDEHLMMMEGPEVADSATDDELLHQQECVDWTENPQDMYNRGLDQNACVIAGKPVAEGTVRSVAVSQGDDGGYEENFRDYEKGTVSPDWEVCLDIRDDTSITTSYHDEEYNYRYDDQSNQGYGGQWYDLDDEKVNTYLRSNKNNLPESVTTNIRSGQNTYIDYYYQENPNPRDSKYNPEGNREGTAILADCGPLLPACGNENDDPQQGINGEEGTYFAFLQETYNGEPVRDEDYHPQGENSETGINPRFNPAGTINMIKSRSDQLTPGTYDYDNEFSGIEWYRDTQVDQDSAVQYAYTKYQTWSIAATGVPYPPFGAQEIGNYVRGNEGVYYREDSSADRGQDPNSQTIDKTERAFGNSLAVVAQRSGISDNQGNAISEGEGYWIDPDDMHSEWRSGNIAGIAGLNPDPDSEGWRNLLTFKVDLTGPDAGIGYDLGQHPEYGLNNDEVVEQRQNGKTVFADIYWESQYQGDSSIPSSLQEPVCGDDQNEYLLEELGEVNNSARYDGNYACTTTTEVCYDSGADGKRLFNRESYRDTNDFSESEGRTKNDEETCREYDWSASRFSGVRKDYFPGWYDQDFREQYCRENTLYEEEGVRWFEASTVENNPHAFTGGIDDDWNEYVDDKLGNQVDPYKSRPDQSSWSSTETPVPTGTNGENMATKGFCGGDDDAEYLVTQDASTSIFESDNTVQGVATGPDVCVADGEVIASNQEDVNSVEYEDSDGNWQPMTGTDSRRLVQEGRRIRLNYDDDAREATCFAGSFLEDWPVVFQEKTVSVPEGNTVTTTFRLINPDEQEIEYEVEMDTTTDSSVSGAGLDSFTSLVDQDGQTEFTTEVPARSAKRYQVEIRGGNTEISDPDDNYVRVFADSTDDRITGSDRVGVQVTEPSSTGAGRQADSLNEVPGLMPVQLLTIVMLALAAVFIS
jgi:hypothetical protein